MKTVDNYVDTVYKGHVLKTGLTTLLTQNSL